MNEEIEDFLKGTPPDQPLTEQQLTAVQRYFSMCAFDGLPRPVRNALNNCTDGSTPITILNISLLLRDHPEQMQMIIDAIKDHNSLLL